jgi:hypothetical protein
MRHGRRLHPNQVSQRQSRERTRHGTGVSTIWHGAYTLPMIAAKAKKQARTLQQLNHQTLKASS